MTSLTRSLNAPITRRHVFGWKCEKILHPILEEVLQEPLTKTSNRFNSIDFKGSYWTTELKSRPKIDERGQPQDSERFNTWVLPCCKVVLPETQELVDDSEIDGEIAFFYFWEGDNSLWFCRYNKQKFETYLRGVPVWHTQEHFFIPRRDWERIDCLIPEIPASSS